MQTALQTQRKTLMKAHVTDGMTQARKGLRFLKRGVERFVSRRPAVTAFVAMAFAFLTYRIVAGRR